MPWPTEHGDRGSWAPKLKSYIDDADAAATTHADAGDDAHVASLHSRYYKRLSPVPTNHVVNNIANRVMRGVFTPSSDTVRAVFGASGYARGICQFYFDLAWKQGGTPGDPFNISNVGWYEALEPNLVSVGSIIVPGSTSRELLISGLTPGDPVSWEIYLNDATYSNKYPTGASPKFLAVLDRLQGGSVYSSERYVAAVRVTNVDIVKVPLFNAERDHSSEPVAALTLPATGWSARFSPDGTTLAIVCFASSQGYLVLIDTTTWTITRTVTLAASKAFTCLAWTSDSARVWVGESTTHLLYPVTASTGAIGSSVSVNAQPVELRRRTGTNDIYVLSSTAQSLQVIDGAAGTIKSTLAMGALTPLKICFTPDGSKCYVACVGSSIVKEVDLSGAAPALTGRTVSASSTVRNLAVDPGTVSLVAVSNQTYWWWDLATLTQYDTGPMGSTTCQDLVMGNDGAIYIAETTENQVFCWPGGSLYINDEVTSGIRADWCDLAVWGAVAGPSD